MRRVVLECVRAWAITRGSRVGSPYRETRHGCCVCGAAIQDTPEANVLPDALVEAWGIRPAQRRLYDAREGGGCCGCGLSGRDRSLARGLLVGLGAERSTLLEVLPSLKDTRIAEVNRAKELHELLSRLPRLVYSEYESVDPAIPNENLEAQSYADASFDVLLVSDTLEHLPRLSQALSEIVRVLRPGGFAVLTVPVLWDRLTRERARVGPDGELQHLLPPSHHVSAQMWSPGSGFFVYREFGSDTLDQLSSAGRVEVAFLDLWRNPYNCAFLLWRGGDRINSLRSRGRGQGAQWRGH